MSICRYIVISLWSPFMIRNQLDKFQFWGKEATLNSAQILFILCSEITPVEAPVTICGVWDRIRVSRHQVSILPSVKSLQPLKSVISLFFPLSARSNFFLAIWKAYSLFIGVNSLIKICLRMSYYLVEEAILLGLFDFVF